MDQKDLIKYGLIAIGAYLIYKYIEANGGLSAVLGGTAAAAPLPAGTTVTPAQVAAALAAAKAAQPSPPIPTPVSSPVATTAAGCPVGQVNVNGTCIAQVADPISQLMVGLATSSGSGTSLDMDQWNYFYSQATGNPSPVDPGSIPVGVYAGAGIVDRTTPTDIGTWLAIMQNQSPSSGLSAFFGLGGPRYTPAWLM